MATNKFTYDAAGNLRTLSDGKSQLTSWGYDTYGRVASKTNDTGTEILDYLYDANNRLTNRWSVAKGNTAYLYDAVGNLTNITLLCAYEKYLVRSSLSMRAAQDLPGLGNARSRI